VAGSLTRVASLNRYAYAHANPTSLTDPSGYAAGRVCYRMIDEGLPHWILRGPAARAHAARVAASQARLEARDRATSSWHELPGALVSHQLESVIALPGAVAHLAWSAPGAAAELVRHPERIVEAAVAAPGAVAAAPGNLADAVGRWAVRIERAMATGDEDLLADALNQAVDVGLVATGAVGATRAGMLAAGRRGAATVAPEGALGDLTPAEVRQIQNVVDEAGRPLEVVGSAARGARRGIGTYLPIGKGAGTRSDIEYLVPHGSLPYYETTGLYQNLPDLDRIIPGIHNPYIGPAVRFEPFADPYFVPGAGG
jgi:hypothetical protein